MGIVIHGSLIMPEGLILTGRGVCTHGQRMQPYGGFHKYLPRNIGRSWAVGIREDIDASICLFI